MFTIILYIMIILLFAFLRFGSYQKQKTSCLKSEFIIPKRTYTWHIIGSLTVLILMTMILCADQVFDIETFLPDWLFVILLGIVSGMCFYIAIVYFFPHTGIYENGILTHFAFIPSHEIAGYAFTMENALNINVNIRTLVIYPKKQTGRNPSLEYLVKDEEQLRSALNKLNIREMPSFEEMAVYD